jgi:spermidine/putrescine transport system ATP-binding protein
VVVNPQGSQGSTGTPTSPTSPGSQGSRAGSNGGGPALTLDRVVKRFGDVTAVGGISFEIARREFFSLLGPSGCGKTTTLRILAGFETPTEGRILIEGRDASRLAPHERDTNMVFQSYALFPHMTVAQNIAFGPQRKRLGREEIERRVRTSLAAVRLEGYSKRYPRELSGGQQQRVALARALANQPSVLLLDEPLGALDLKLREEMQFELKRIQREVGISFVYVTHDQGEALTMSDRIAVMNGGVVEHLGTPEEIYLRPATLFVAGFIGQTSFLPCRVEAVRPDGVDVRLSGGTAARVDRAGGDVRADTDGVLIVRPEHVRVSAAAPEAGRPAVAVRVQEEVFQGSVVRYQLEASGGVSIAALVPLEERADVHPGDEAWASWLPTWAYLLPGGPVAAAGSEAVGAGPATAGSAAAAATDPTDA